MTTTLKLEFSANQTSRIKSMAEIQSVSEGEVVKRALALYDMALKEQFAGNKLSITNGEGSKILKKITL